MEEVKFSKKNQPCYDKNGNFIGWFSRSIATAIFVYCKDKNGNWHVLASERGKGTPDFHGYWNCPCGYLDFDETVAGCSTRELLEETGVSIKPSKLIFIGYEDSPSANHQNVTFRFASLIYDKTINEIEFSKEKNEQDEVGEIAWIKLDEIGKHKWAFGHENRIMEIASQMKIV